jgi:hypothetical protein
MGSIPKSSVVVSQSEPDSKHDAQAQYLNEQSSNSTIQDFMMANTQSQSQQASAYGGKSMNNSV